MVRGGASRRRDARGQTHIDFVVGIVLFLLAFTFVVAAVPQLIAPYDDQATPVVADRVAASLSESLLVGDKEPGVLDPKCVDAYFGGSSTCAAFDKSAPLTDRSGVASHYSINVELTGDVDGDGTIETRTTGDSVPAEHRAVSLDRQIVMLNGEPATLEVRVW